MRHPDMEALTDLSPTDGEYTLPADYLAYRKVVVKNNPRRDLEYVAPRYLDWRYGDRSSGIGEVFTIQDGKIRLAEATANDIELSYYQKLDLATDSTNWLLTLAPDVYLYGSLLHALTFLSEMDTPRFQTWAIAYDRSIQAVKGQGNIAQMSRGGVRLRSPTP